MITARLIAYVDKLRYLKQRTKLLYLISELTNHSNLGQFVKVLFKSQSQLNQELLVLSLMGYKDTGFFVEVGATDGVFLSNTLLLEQKGWQGILFEPCKSWHSMLVKNRLCQIDNRAVTNKGNQKVIFSETSRPELSTISSMKPNDNWYHDRLSSNDYLVDTVTLTKALNEHSAPKMIDYLSIDTEGSEYEVLLGCNFKNNIFKIITVEIAGDQVKRDSILLLLNENGYTRIFSDETLWEDWYIHETLF